MGIEINSKGAKLVRLHLKESTVQYDDLICSM